MPRTNAPDITRPDAAVLPANVPFRDAEAARRNLARIRQLAPAAVQDALAALLPSSPNPDAAVNQFERLAESASPDLLRLLEKHPFLIHYAVVVFADSSWLGDTLVHNPDLFHGLVRDKSLDRAHSHEEFQESFARMRSRSFETDTAVLLARFKKREYVRIMLRDVLGVATLAETTAEISALSDVLIEEALREVHSQLQHRYGSPQQLDPEGRVTDSRFAVLSLGKLGGNELNYSSDIDLLYLYDGGVEPPGAEIPNREYFIRLAQQTTELLSRHTREGPVFRIDLRLRPQGNEGEPAVPLPHAIHYYSHVAHDWELQAMIKVRHSAGDVGLAREFVRRVQPFVYRPELNFRSHQDGAGLAGENGKSPPPAPVEADRPKRHRCKAGPRRHSRYRVPGAVPAAGLWRKRIVAAFAGHHVCPAEAVRQGTHQQQRLSQPHQRLRIPAQPGTSPAIAPGPADASAAGIALGVGVAGAQPRPRGYDSAHRRKSFWPMCKGAWRQ